MCSSIETAMRRSTFDLTGLTRKQIQAKAASLHHRESIRSRIAELMQQRSLRTGIDADWVLSQAVQVFEEAQKGDDPKLALETLKVIGKHVDVQAFKERVEVNTIDHAAILEERIAAADKLRKQLN